MSHPQPLSYSAALGQSTSSASGAQESVPAPADNGSKAQPTSPKKHTTSPSHVPRTSADENSVYVLTLLTDRAHHSRMTALRKKYFPKKLNKLAAHLTLFHALPGSKLQSNIIPKIEEVAAQTSPFPVRATEVFRMRKGFAVSLSDGSSQGSEIHKALKGAWKKEGFLSEQDAGGCRLHYTLMNKVDDEKAVDGAYQEFLDSWQGDEGMVEGLTLWRYERGFWKFERKFEFGR